MNKILRFFLVLIVIFLLFILFLWIFRLALPRQLDDVSPEISCENEVLAKSDILMVIPLFDNVSIAENKTWCEKILALNKTLGMHGVYHTYQEFYEPRDKDYVLLGMEEFKKCFGFYPKIFGVPHFALGKENERTLKNMDFSIHNKFYYLTHKVYHCQEKGEFAFKIGKVQITNKLIDFV